MSDTEITLVVPEDLAREAQQFDVLEPETILKLLRSEVDQRIMDFVDAEVKAYRAEKSAKDKYVPVPRP